MHAGVRRIHSVNTPRLVDEGNLLTGDSKDIPCSPPFAGTHSMFRLVFRLFLDESSLSLWGTLPAETA